MNRLVVIGNGFDLAHGLPTSYKHFIDDFWKNFRDNVKTEEYRKFIYANELYYQYYSEYGQINNFKDFKAKIGECIKDNPKYFFDEKRLIFYTSQFNGQEVIFRFENEFFSQINIKNCENWVDIENEYYRELKKIIKSKSLDVSKSEEYWSKEQKKQIVKLNGEFEEIKNLLESYLSKTFNTIYNFESILKLEIIDHLKSNPSFQDFLFEKEDAIFYKEKKNLELGNTLLLSFNYTKTVLDYSNYLLNEGLDINYNYIHGKMGVKELPIIFGFGDEMDDDYKEVENIDDNEYLKYFKSIQYLEHSNYKYLYNFVEKEPFQVFVFGHSCGLSDRTLLSTIFENRNCFSVKVFYYVEKKGSDNYTELIQNISRHFSDKKMLRKKVVEKRHCESLIKLVDKENGSLS